MFNPDRVTYFAATDSRGKKVPFGLKAKDRQRHMYVIGKTGMGKSTLLENMAIQDIQNGEGMCFIDPHGSAVETLLNYIPKDRVNDVVYFAPFDLDHPIAFNVMEDVGYDKRHLVVSGLMATFKKIWEDAWSARMEYILTNTLLALLEYPDATLLGVNRMYSDKVYRTKVVDNIKDPVVKAFWTEEYAKYTDKFAAEATPAIQNKIGQFTGNPLIRNIIGQPKSSFDIRDLMDNNKILLINLSKGLVGDTNMRLLGSMLTTRIFLAAMSRADLPPAELKNAQNFYFYVDEFQNFANDTFSEILSEARKYSLNLVIAHQYIEQMEEQVRAAVFGNVGTTVAYRVGPLDAEFMETIFTPEFTKEDLVSMGQYQMYLTLMIDGVGSRPFSATGLPPIEPPPVSYAKDSIEASRAQFGARRANIEESIFAELAAQSAAAEPPPKRAPSSSSAPRREGGPSSSQSSSGGQGSRPSAPRRTEEPRSASNGERRPSPGSGPRPESRNENRGDRGESRDERPAPKAKTGEDLKAILRGMVSSSEKKEPANTEAAPAPLKNALSNVLTRSDMQPAEPERAAAPKPKQHAQSQPHAQAPAHAQPQHSAPREPEKNAEPKPFEVPEDTLKAIFGEKL